MSSSFSFYAIVLILFGCILTPPLPLLGMPAIRLDQVVVFLAFGYLLLLFLVHKVQIRHEPLFTYSAMMLFVYTLLSCFIGGIKGYSFVLNDFFELFKPFEYLVVGLLLSTAIQQGSNRTKVLEMIVLFSVASAFVAFSQYINPFGINSVYVPIIAPTQYVTLVDNYPWPRVVGLASNPNVFASLMVVASSAALLLFVDKKKKTHLLFWFIFAVALMLSRSRTGLIFFIIVNIVFFVPCVFHRVFKKKNSKVYINYNSLLWSVGGIVLFLLIFWNIIVSSDFLIRIEDGLNWRESLSMQGRFENWERYFIIIWDNLFLGVGPAKALEGFSTADSEWLLLLSTIIFLFFLFSPFFFKSEPEYRHYSLMSIGLLVGASIYMLSASLYHSMQVFPVFLILTMLKVEGHLLTIGLNAKDVAEEEVVYGQ